MANLYIFLYQKHGLLMTLFSNAKHQRKSIITCIFTLVFFFSISIYNASGNYHIIQLTEARQLEHQERVLRTSSTASSNATTLTPTDLFSKVQDSVV